MAKGPGGRPTTYNEEVLELARDYVENCPNTVPMVVGLCKHIGRAKATVYAWAKEEGKEEFSDILREIEENQHIQLIEGGLDNSFNSAITKMMLTKHGYSDKVEQDVTSGGKSINSWVVNPVTTDKNG